MRKQKTILCVLQAVGDEEIVGRLTSVASEAVVHVMEMWKVKKPDVLSKWLDTVNRQGLTLILPPLEKNKRSQRHINSTMTAHYHICLFTDMLLLLYRCCQAVNGLITFWGWFPLDGLTSAVPTASPRSARSAFGE